MDSQYILDIRSYFGINLHMEFKRFGEIIQGIAMLPLRLHLDSKMEKLAKAEMAGANTGLSWKGDATKWAQETEILAKAIKGKPIKRGEYDFLSSLAIKILDEETSSVTIED